MDRHLVEVDGGYVLLVRAFQRTGPLHMVEGFKDGAHYLRVGHKTRRMKQHEIERAYAHLASQDDRLDALLNRDRTQARLTRSRAQHQLELAAKGVTDPKWRPWIYVVTAPLDASPVVLPMRSPSEGDFRDKRDGKLKREPLFDGPFAIDAGGYVIEAMAEPDTGFLRRRLRLYRSGVFEFGWRFDVEDWRTIPAVTLLEHSHDALVYFACVYAEVGYHGRLATFIGIDNADEGTLMPPRHLGYPAGVSANQAQFEDLRVSEDTNVDALLRDPMPITHKAMDFIWQSFGHNRCWLISPEGEYDPRGR